MIATVSNFYSQLHQRGALRISGPDSRSFLQGQTSCDIEQLGSSHSISGAYCTPQGRMVCDFRLLALAEDDLLLLMPGDICPLALQTFAKYIVFSRAEIAVATQSWAQLAAWGPGIGQTIGAPETASGLAWQHGNSYWVQVDAQGQHFEAVTPAGELVAATEALADCAESVAESRYQLQEILAGVAHVSAATSGMFLPQMLNYQLTDRVSFSKGCYTGQEVVARMHYRGKVKRPMLHARADIDAAPAAATPLFSKNREQSVGHVLGAAASSDGVHLLVNVERKAIAGDVHLAEPGGALLEFLPLPYALEDEDSA
ncbi:MAG: hypothetical protein ABJ308_00525 [Halieaceae bacterium]